MNKGLIFALGIVIGGAGGGLVMKAILKQQYEQKADEEIAACRNAFLAELEKRRAEDNAKEHEAKKEAAAEAMQTYSPEPEKAADGIRKADVKKDKSPYIIHPSVFDDPTNPYPSEGFKYYADGALVRKDGSILDLEEIDTCIGREALTHFGEYEEDRVCVRNEKLNKDYEIIMFNQKYADILGEKTETGK